MSRIALGHRAGRRYGRRRAWQRASALPACVVHAVLLASCGAAPAVDPDPYTVTVGYRANEWAMSPGSDDTPGRLVFQHMVYYDELWCGAPQPGLAERWEHSEDRRVWTLHLRPDNRWHDGTPVTARDIAWTIETWNHPEVEHWYGQDVDSAVVIDDHTVKLYHSRPSEMALDGWLVYYPHHLLKDLDPKGFYEWEWWKAPVGNGPFRYVRHVPETFTEYEANPDWFEGEPEVKRLILRYGDSGLPQLLAGEVDLLQSVSPLDAKKVEGDPRFYVYHEWVPSGFYLVWNVNRAPLDDVRVRRALTMALDRKTMHRTLAYPDSMLVTDGIYTPCQFQRRELPPAWPFDPDSAAALLEAAGWRDADGDGVREKDGRPLRFELRTRGGNEAPQQAGLFIQAELRRLGVAVDLAPMEPTIHREHMARGDFDAYIGAGPGHGWNWVRNALTSVPGGYRNPEVTRLMARADSVDLPLRDSIAAAVSEIVYEELPMTFLFSGIQTHIIAARIRGLSEWRGPLAYLHRARIEVEP